MSGFSDYDDDAWRDHLEEDRDTYARDEAEEEWFQEQLSERLEEVIDGNFQTIFQSKVAPWSRHRWPQAEANAYRVGREARRLSKEAWYGPAVVWSATCVEIIFRDLTLKPIFVGLFLGGQWADKALNMMLANRWVRRDTRTIAETILAEIANVDVTALEVKGLRPWGEIDKLLRTRNAIVHGGEAASSQDATWAVNVAAARMGGRGHYEL